MKPFLLLLLLSTSSFIFGQEQAELITKTPFTIGETVSIQSKLLDEKRELNIYLPASYGADSTASYPVIYLLDGSADEDFIHIAGLVQFGSFSWINLVPESIVVGISNIDRKRDFTYPTKNKKDLEDFPTTGHSAAFIEFIGQELQPFIDSNYRTTSEKTIIGQSLGGLLATEILYKQPELFQHYLIVSPSLWWDDESLLDAELPAFESKKSVYVAVGKEGEIMERTAKALYEQLKKEKCNKHAIYFDFLADKSHGDALHLAVYHAFEQIFKSEQK